MFSLKPAAKKAIMVGSLCSISYLAVYIARNVLGSASPQMIEKGIFDTEQVGLLSSIYFIAYAIGQLINGAIGDKIKAKYMIGFGLILAGISNIFFSLLADNATAAYLAYGFTGFFLSMIYGPMTKVVAENTEPIYTARCSLGYTFASFFGSPMAGVLAALFVWQGVFAVSSGVLLIMGMICLIAFTSFEKKGIVQYNKFNIPKGQGGGIKVLIQRQIIKFTLISALTGIVRTTVVFWLPTYISQYLKFSAEESALIYTVATLVISASAFIAVFVYERLNRNINITVLLFFLVSAFAFLSVYLIKTPILNIVLMVLAIIASNCSASMLWSVYCPSLKDTGMVSGATGFLDFISYMAASVSSTLFANAVTAIGWGRLILIWFALMVCAVIVTLPYRNIIRRINNA